MVVVKVIDLLEQLDVAVDQVEDLGKFLASQ
jgi:hypothetical protein